MNTLQDQHAGMDETMQALRLDPLKASALVEFANQHDDGGPMPRAHYDRDKDAVVVRSLAIDTDGHQVNEYDEVRSMRALRDVLGY